MRLLITGPESSGKSTLSRALAWSLDGIFVPEQARRYLAERGNRYGPEDLPQICREQVLAETLAAKLQPSFLVCDTGPEVILIWSEVRFGQVDPFVKTAFNKARYDLVLLCAPDLPWTYDPQREHPEETDRWDLFERYQALLPGANVIGGSYRTAAALDLIFQHVAVLGRRK